MGSEITRTSAYDLSEPTSVFWLYRQCIQLNAPLHVKVDIEDWLFQKVVN